MGIIYIMLIVKTPNLIDILETFMLKVEIKWILKKFILITFPVILCTHLSIYTKKNPPKNQCIRFLCQNPIMFSTCKNKYDVGLRKIVPASENQ